MCAYVCVCACVCVCVLVCEESRPRVPLTSTQALSLTHSLSVTRARARARTHGTLATAGVTIALSVQYLQQPEEVVDEIARVLQPGGKCIVAFSNRMFPSKVSACLLACALCVCALRASRVRQCEGLLFARWRARPCAGCIGFNARASACKGSGPCIYTGRTAAASELEFEGERSLVCCGQKRGRTLAAHLVRLLPYTHLHPHVQALNDHINVEYTASYAYHALFSYFDRDTVGLAGFAKFFAEQSLEERGHAEEFMKYQNIRGGKVCVCVLAGIRGSVA
jgi:SAM-dependent methyltransferase